MISAHPSCLDLTEEMVGVVQTYPWQCMECKTCVECMDPYDEVSILIIYFCFCFSNEMIVCVSTLVGINRIKLSTHIFKGARIEHSSVRRGSRGVASWTCDPLLALWQRFDSHSAASPMDNGLST